MHLVQRMRHHIRLGCGFSCAHHVYYSGIFRECSHKRSDRRRAARRAAHTGAPSVFSRRLCDCVLITDELIYGNDSDNMYLEVYVRLPTLQL